MKQPESQLLAAGEQAVSKAEMIRKIIVQRIQTGLVAQPQTSGPEQIWFARQPTVFKWRRSGVKAGQSVQGGQGQQHGKQGD